MICSSMVLVQLQVHRYLCRHAPEWEDKTKHMYQVVCKHADCVANAKIKYSYLILPMQNKNTT